MQLGKLVALEPTGMKDPKPGDCADSVRVGPNARGLITTHAWQAGVPFSLQAARGPRDIPTADLQAYSRANLPQLLPWPNCQISHSSLRRRLTSAHRNFQ